MLRNHPFILRPKTIGLFSMRCPHCRSPLLTVHVSFSGDVACQFSGEQSFQILEKVALESEFDEEANCRCMACGWDGQVAETQTASAQLRSARSPGQSISYSYLSLEALEQIKIEIESFETRPKQISQRLVKEINRLASLLDTVTRLCGSADGASTDTSIG